MAYLLGRKQLVSDKQLLQMDVTDKSVLVTGAGGYIGSELCRQIAKLNPSCLVLHELNELGLNNIDIELAKNYPSLNRVPCIGSVNNENLFTDILKKYRIDTVYHAAAYNFAPLLQANPSSGILKNVFGTLTAARCASECGVSKFVLISTDKAVLPTTVMGATKRIAEMILQALAEEASTTTCFTMVRFGNILASSSFSAQKVHGRLDIIRNPMPIAEAASLVIQAGAMATGGEVFFLNMGNAVRLYDWFLQLMRLIGVQPGQDIKITITGLTWEEKKYGELLIDTANVRRTRHPKIFCAYENSIPWKLLSLRLQKLLFHVQQNNLKSSLSELRHILPDYINFANVESESQKLHQSNW
jgi:FlaA1/EpsC-like NDP-sugar epimerase